MGYSRISHPETCLTRVFAVSVPRYKCGKRSNLKPSMERECNESKVCPKEKRCLNKIFRTSTRAKEAASPDYIYDGRGNRCEGSWLGWSEGGVQRIM